MRELDLSTYVFTFKAVGGKLADIHHKIAELFHSALSLTLVEIIG